MVELPPLCERVRLERSRLNRNGQRSAERINCQSISATLNRTVGIRALPPFARKKRRMGHPPQWQGKGAPPAHGRASATMRKVRLQRSRLNRNGQRSAEGINCQSISVTLNRTVGIRALPPFARKKRRMGHPPHWQGKSAPPAFSGRKTAGRKIVAPPEFPERHAHACVCTDRSSRAEHA